MHVYRLEILLTILFIVICMYYVLLVCIFLLSYYTFHFFFTPSKRSQNYFPTIRHILDVLFIPLIYSYSYLHYTASFTLTSLYLFTLTYLYLSMFSLYYYMNMIKLIKYEKYRNYDKTFEIEKYF